MPFGGLLSAGISAGSSLLGGLFGGNSQQEAMKQYMAQLQKGQDFLQDQEKQGLQDYQPYLDAGSKATGTLSDLLAAPGQGLLTPWSQTFHAPTAAEAEATPGYQFQLQQGENAMQNSAAGRGGLLSGRTLADLNNYAQGTASTNYQNTFNNALTQYQTAYNGFRNNQQDQYSRLMGMSGQGLQATQGAGNLRQGFGGDIASLYGQMGAAQAQGTIAQGNTMSNMIGGIGNAISGGLTMKYGLGGGTSSDSMFADPGLHVMQPSYMPGGGSPSAPNVPMAPGYSLSDLGFAA